MVVYIFQCETFVKVGISSDVKKRVKALQPGNPFPIRILRTSRTRSRIKALLIERTVHNILSDDHHFGEWFKCTPERAREALSAVMWAMPRLVKKHDAIKVEREHLFATDPEYNAALDAHFEVMKLRNKHHAAREEAIQKAAREFDANSDYVPPEPIVRNPRRKREAAQSLPDYA